MRGLPVLEQWSGVAQLTVETDYSWSHRIGSKADDMNPRFAVALATIVTVVFFATYDSVVHGLAMLAEVGPKFGPYDMIRTGTLALCALLLGEMAVVSQRQAGEVSTVVPMWLGWLASISALALAIVSAVDPDLFYRWRREDGVVENLSAIALFVGSVSFVAAALWHKPSPRTNVPGIRYWLLGAGVCLFVIGMEEISWMQRIVGFETPEALQQLNRQKEVNIHNLSSDLFEVLYYVVAVLTLVIAPFLTGHLARYRLTQPLVAIFPSRQIAYISLPVTAFNYDMWNTIPMQLAFFLPLALLSVQIRRVWHRDKSEATVALGAMFAAVAAQGLMIAYGDSLRASWDPTEYKELFIAAGLMLFGIETWRRQTHQEPVTAIDEESGHDVPDEPLAPEAPVTTSPLYSPYIFLLVGISMSVVIAVRDHTLGLRRNAQTEVTYHKGNCVESLSRSDLDESLNLGTRYLVTNRSANGRFRYAYDWVNDEQIRWDYSVHQAEALWGLALANRELPKDSVRAALTQTLGFFESRSRAIDNARYLDYPSERKGRLGSLALLALTYSELLRDRSAYSDEELGHFANQLDGYVLAITRAWQDNGGFREYYNPETGDSFGNRDPYDDGQALLALTHVAVYLGREELREQLLRSVEAAHQIYIARVLVDDTGTQATNVYYRWASLTYFALATSGWPEAQVYGDRLIALSQWMVGSRFRLNNSDHLAYVYQGMVLAYELAVRRGNRDLAQSLGCALESGLDSLTRFQLGTYRHREFVGDTDQLNPRAIGGVQLSEDSSRLRIDVTQQQVHLAILARRYLLTE